MITRKGIWLSYNKFKMINGQTINVVPYNYLNELLDQEIFPFKAYILVKQDNKDFIVYSYIKESDLQSCE